MRKRYRLIVIVAFCFPFLQGTAELRGQLPLPDELPLPNATTPAENVPTLDPSGPGSVPSRSPFTSAPANFYPRDPTVRVKDITFVEGERANHVMGEGLVFGLSGTGGRAQQTQSMAQNFFLRKGIRLGMVETRSMSAVVVTGTIPPFARKGETIQVTVSVADDSQSLRGGTLYQAVLRGIDNKVYAIAHGPVIGGGVTAGGNAATLQKNHPTVGVCEAIVEREICNEGVRPRGIVRLVLRNKEHTTAVSIANALNNAFPQTSQAIDAGTVEVIVPAPYRSRLPEFISMIGQLRVQPDQRARVVINQKTGTIVIGQNVRISKVLFANESLVISTAETPIASQPAPFSRGETTVLPRTAVQVFETDGRYNSLTGGITVGDLGNALNGLGISPNTMINIFTTLRKQGALQAELIIE